MRCMTVMVMDGLVLTIMGVKLVTMTALYAGEFDYWDGEVYWTSAVAGRIARRRCQSLRGGRCPMARRL